MDKRISNKITNDFYLTVRKYLKRYNPFEFSLAASELLRQSETKYRSYYPPHFLLHAIEMNCYYFREYYKKPLDQTGFDKLIDIYHAYLDPYQSHELAEGPDIGLFNFFISMAISQFPFQRHFNSNVFSRSILLFCESEIMENSRSAFKKQFGLSIRDWLIYCFFIFAWLSKNNRTTYRAENLLSSEIKLPTESLEPFLLLSSIEQTGVINEHNSREKDYPPFLRIFMKSIFFDYPFIRFSHDYVNPHPNLISYLVCEKVHSLLSEIQRNEFQSQFGQAFEEFLGLLLNDLGEVSVYNETQIQNKYSLNDEQVCDYLVEFSDCILLIETKAIQYTKRIINLDYLRESNTSNKIAKAYDQLLATAEKIRTQKNQMIFAICVTFGQLYLSNKNIYFEQTIKPNMHNKIDKNNFVLDFEPQNLSVDEFERFLHALISYNEIPSHIFQMIEADRSVQYMDWHTFLSNHFPYKEKDPESILSKKYFEFFRKSGLIK